MVERFLRITPHLTIPLAEIAFHTSRSGGPGGQNVNKLETKVELIFDVVSAPPAVRRRRPANKPTLTRATPGQTAGDCR